MSRPHPACIAHRRGKRGGRGKRRCRACIHLHVHHGIRRGLCREKKLDVPADKGDRRAKGKGLSAGGHDGNAENLFQHDCRRNALNVWKHIVNIFLGGKSREFAFPKIGKRIGERIGKRARAAPCCARCTPRAALTRRASHAAAPRPCAQHHSACAGPRRRAAHRVPILKN